VKPAELPLTHPGLVLQRPQRYSTLREFLDSEASVPVEDGGLFTPEDVNEYAPETIIKDAQLLMRLEDAAAQQYSHQDHLNRAAIEFRKLMLLEERKHRHNAKRLVEACRDEWYRRQPKTLEQ